MDSSSLFACRTIEFALLGGLIINREFNVIPIGLRSWPNTPLKPNNPNMPALLRPFIANGFRLGGTLLVLQLSSWPTWQVHGGRTAGTTAESPQEHRSPIGLNCCGFREREREHVHVVCWRGLGWKRANCCGRGTRVNEQEQTSSPSAPQTHWAAICSKNILINWGLYCIVFLFSTDLCNSYRRDYASNEN